MVSGTSVLTSKPLMIRPILKNGVENSIIIFIPGELSLWAFHEHNLEWRRIPGYWYCSHEESYLAYVGPDNYSTNINILLHKKIASLKFHY